MDRMVKANIQHISFSIHDRAGEGSTPRKRVNTFISFQPIIIFRIFDTKFSFPSRGTRVGAQCVSGMELFCLLCCLPFCRKIHQKKATFPSPSFKLRSISNCQQTLMLQVLESMLIVEGGRRRIEGYL